MTLPSSASLPMRSTMALSGLPEDAERLLMPAESISDDARTKTTSAMPSAVAMRRRLADREAAHVVANGDHGCPSRDPPEGVDDLELRRAPRRE